MTEMINPLSKWSNATVSKFHEMAPDRVKRTYYIAA